HTLDHLLAPPLENLRDGESVSFGPLTLSMEGIHSGKTMLPWSRYGHGEAERGQVTIYDNERGKAFCKLKTAEVPNVHVLIGLADFLGRPSKTNSISEGLSS